jgi:hypothetical protein
MAKVYDDPAILQAINLLTDNYCEGVFVGGLTDDELTAFNLLVSKGLAHRSYSGVGALLGLAKVRLNDVPEDGPSEPRTEPL